MDQNIPAYWGWTTIGVLQCMSAPVANPLLSGVLGWNMAMRAQEKELPALICLTDRELGHLSGFYFVRDLGRVDVRCKSIRQDHP